MQVNNFFHNFCCGGLEAHLSGCRCVKKEGSKAVFSCLATESLSVGNACRVDASRVALSYRILYGKHIKNNVEEEERRDNGNHRSQRGDIVSTSKCVRVVGNTARHSGKTKEVHGEEGKIYTDEEGSEVDFTKSFIVG